MNGVSRATLALTAVLTLIAGALAAFLLTHFVIDHHSASTPDPDTITCHKWMDLSTQQKQSVLRQINSENGTSAKRGDVDSGCGVDIASTVYGIVVNAG